MSAPLTITKVVKAYGKKRVLDDISFSANVGEFVVLVGPSGCGKSTMLRAIAGLEKIDSGQIRIGEKDVTRLDPKDRDIAMVFQDYALYPHKSVYENIAFGLRVRRMDEATIDARVKDAAQKLGLTHYLDRRPAALSGGQRQRVAIGRAIVRKPQVFLFDEPLSNLDAKLRGTMRIELAKLHKDLQATIVYVTHDQVEAMTLADKIVVLSGGVIQQMGSPLDLYYHPRNAFVATFIGSPPMNLVEGKLEHVSGVLTFKSDGGGLTLVIPESYRETVERQAKPGETILWGIRPENMRVEEHPVTKTKPVVSVYDARVTVTEMLGATSSVVCDVGGHELHVTLPEPHRPKRGETIRLAYASTHLYMFSKSSGLSVSESWS
jgi:multiple sugar transport system ATP-binding protein